MIIDHTAASTTTITKAASPAGSSHTFGLDALNGITRFDSIAEATAAGYNNQFSSSRNWARSSVTETPA
jgi:hypothetical protein